MQVFLPLTALLIASNIACDRTNGQLQCRDENNFGVDWYVLYKLPKDQTSRNSLIRKGLAYLYITNSTVGTDWRLSARSIGSNASIPGITLAPLYDRRNEENNLWSLYNDSPPNASDVSHRGHTKGAVMVNRQQGFWLIHSVPNFPSAPIAGAHSRPLNKGNLTVVNRYAYPESGTSNGQSFLCISLGADQFNTVGEQLMYNEIAVYAKNIPEALGRMYPVLTNATNHKRIKQAPYNHKAVVRSLGSVEFTSFAKSGKWGYELYADFVAKQLQSNMFVQSWLNGRGKLPSTCSGRKIYNIKSLRFMMPGLDIVYSSTRDHSKWAMSETKKGDKQWVCIGDINRASTQFSRGGGAVCLKNAQLWSHYRGIVNDVELCRAG